MTYITNKTNIRNKYSYKDLPIENIKGRNGRLLFCSNQFSYLLTLDKAIVISDTDTVDCSALS